MVRLTYTADTEGNPIINDESIEFRWFTEDEMKALPVKELDDFFAEILFKIF